LFFHPKKKTAIWSGINTVLNRAAARAFITETDCPAVSVIIPAYNRKDELQELLAALDRQTLAPAQFEIIVIDDGSTDDTLAYLASLVNSGEKNLVFQRQENQGPGAARNHGMKLARGDIFAFTDTDCRPLPDWLEKLLGSFADRRVGAAGGAEEYDAHGTVTQQAIHISMTSFLTTGGIRGAAGTNLTRYYPRTFNMAISREAFMSAGGFRQLDHGPIYGEDIDLSIRIEQAGLAILFNKDAKVYHRRRDSLRGFFKQVLKMGEARATLARMHPELIAPLHVAPAAGVAVLALALALAPFSSAAATALMMLALLGVVFYAALCITALFRSKRFAVALLAGCAGFVQQAAYGLGFYRGLWKWLWGKNAER
jgi:GT2 family glycosyltransferase